MKKLEEMGLPSLKHLRPCISTNVQVKEIVNQAIEAGLIVDEGEGTFIIKKHDGHIIYQGLSKNSNAWIVLYDPKFFDETTTPQIKKGNKMDKLEVTIKVDGENLGTMEYYKGEFQRAIVDLSKLIKEYDINNINFNIENFDKRY